MHSRTQTQSMETDADPQSIVALLADPTRILDWAPAFADTITGDDQTGWHGTRGGQDFAFRVVTHPDAGTADYLREIAPDRQGGAYLRAVPRPGGGSVVTMTMPVTPGAEPAAVAKGSLRLLRRQAKNALKCRELLVRENPWSTG